MIKQAIAMAISNIPTMFFGFASLYAAISGFPVTAFWMGVFTLCFLSAANMTE